MKVEGNSYLANVIVKTNNPANANENTGDFANKMDQIMQSNERKIYGYKIHVTEPSKLSSKPDYSSMSDAEIYASIENEYKLKYGDDFQEWNILGLKPKDQEQSNILGRFKQDLAKYICGDPRSTNYQKIYEAARQATYGDMDEEEVRATIVKKYSHPGMTYREFMHMTHEMARVGVDNGLRDLSSLLVCSPKGKYVNDYNDNFINILDEPLDVMGLVKNANGMKFASHQFYSDFITKFIASQFNIRVGNDGYLLDK